MSKYNNGSNSAGGFIFTLIIILVLGGFIVGINSCMGVGGFGPSGTTYAATITSKHVDSGESSHYMVSTDKGTFEVDNGLMLGTYNADDIYGKLIVGKTYNINTKGKKVVGWFWQEYPYIIKATEVAKPVDATPTPSVPSVEVDKQKQIDDLQRQLDALKAR